MRFSVDGIIKWIGVLQQIQAKGKPAIDAVRAALAAHGIEADNALLDGVIADDARREALARRDAAGADDVTGPVNTGSTGD